MLIYKLLGDGAEQEFARSWGISYGMNAATEWRSIAEEALKGAVFLLILERLGLTLHTEWLEEHIDYLGLCVRCEPSVARVCSDAPSAPARRQALLFSHTTLNLWRQVGLMFYHSRRVSD